MKRSKKGFTLAELLVVVAIIAILVAIAIPVFTSATDKAERAVETANARSVYAEGMSDRAAGGTATISHEYDGKTYTFGFDTANSVGYVLVTGTGAINDGYAAAAGTYGDKACVAFGGAVDAAAATATPVT